MRIQVLLTLHLVACLFGGKDEAWLLPPHHKRTPIVVGGPSLIRDRLVRIAKIRSNEVGLR